MLFSPHETVYQISASLIF